MSLKTMLFSLVSKTAGLLPQGVRRGLYRLGPASGLIRRTLNRISPSGQHIVSVSAGAIKGMRLKLDLQSEKEYWLGTYEMDLQQAVQSHVRTGWVAYDAGANLGFISLVLAKRVGEDGQVFAFEALPANILRLQENIDLNGFTFRVQVVQAAVTAISGEVKFLVGPSGAMGKVAGSAGREDIHQGEIQVAGVTLDDFVYQEGNPVPQVIKMDIEGGEILALQGMTRLVAEARPLIFLELHGPEAARAAWEVLTGAGYQLCRMARGMPPIAGLSDLDWKSYLVAVP